MRLKKRFTNSRFISKVCTIIFLFILFSVFFSLLFSAQSYDWSAIVPYERVFLKGWLTTCLLSCISLTLSSLLGVILAIARQCSFLPVRYLAAIYIETVRGSPLLVQLLFFFYVIANALSWHSRYWVGVVVLSLFSAAYIAEIIRSGIESTKKSHVDSALAIGLTRLQTYKFVILPMTLRQIIPPLTGQFASIIKDSSLLSILGISEFTYSAQQVSSATYSTLESYFPLAIGYLVLTFPISLISKILERRFKYEA